MVSVTANNRNGPGSKPNAGKVFLHRNPIKSYWINDHINSTTQYYVHIKFRNANWQLATNQKASNF